MNFLDLLLAAEFPDSSKSVATHIYITDQKSKVGELLLTLLEILHTLGKIATFRQSGGQIIDMKKKYIYGNDDSTVASHHHSSVSFYFAVRMAMYEPSKMSRHTMINADF